MLDLILQQGLFASFFAFGIGGILSLALGSRRTEDKASLIAHSCAAVGSLLALAFAVLVIATNSIFTAQVGSIGFIETAFTLRVDALAAFFIATIAVVALAASIYGIAYQKQFLGIYRLGSFGFFYNVFLGSMLAVVVANNGILFLIAWEVMAAASYFLVIFERKEKQNISAGMLYILISQLGAAFLFAAMLLLHNATGSWDFDAIRAGGSAIPALIGNIVLAFALIGFSSKAGIIPLHIWLPEAHPAAPSHVSALMSGVMIKTAIFMIIRFFVEFFPADPIWGLIILGLGAISSLLGVLYALAEHDIKRLLAFHSVENIGIIFLGIGGAVVFFAYGIPQAGFIALAAGLYHTVNHALFKSLLFLSAGSVVHATGTRNMEEYGGLIKKMPYTAFFFLIGAVAISGLPPFNGFVSEWLTFQSLFAGVAALPFAPKMVFLIGAASLAFTGGLAAACFVKAFGVTFLARPRHVHKAIHEAGALMKAPMALLAFLALAFGVGATAVTSVVVFIAGSLKGPTTAPFTLADPLHAINIGNFSILSMAGVFAVMAIGILAVYIPARVVLARRKVVISRTWNCGAPLTPRMEITATAFSRSIITIFRGLLRPSLQKDAEYHDATLRYFAKSRMVHLSMPDLYRAYLYDPVALVIEKGAMRMRHIQSGNLNIYLLYIFLTVIALLWWALV